MRILSLVIFLTAITGVAVAQTPIKVACIGNSITEGANIEAGRKYPEQLQALLGSGYEVRNFGLGGRTLLKKGDYPYWNEQLYQDAMTWTPDIVIIKLGTNDSKPQNWKYKDEFESDYRALIQSFKALPGSRKIYVCTPVPVFKDAWGISAAVVKDEMLPLVKVIAKEEHVKRINLFKPFRKKSAMLPDGVHPNGDGAALMAKVIYKKIR